MSFVTDLELSRTGTSGCLCVRGIRHVPSSMESQRVRFPSGRQKNLLSFLGNAGANLPSWWLPEELLFSVYNYHFLLSFIVCSMWRTFDALINSLNGEILSASL